MSRPHVAYVSYTGLAEPLGSSQILPYVRELSGKYRFTIVSFEKPAGPVARDPPDIAEELERQGNSWVALEYHRRLGLLSKLGDILRGRAALRRLERSDPFQLIHARGYVPAEIAVRAGGGVSTPYLFDIRGLQAEESVDAGAWRAGGLRFRLTKWAERRLLARASGIVTLSEAIKSYLRAQPGLMGRELPWEVIPTCVDLDHFRFDPAARARVRAELRLADDQLVFVYSGSVGTWYATDESIALVRGYEGPGRAFLLFLTLAPENDITAICERARLPRDAYAIRAVRRADMPSYLSAGDLALCLVRPSLSKKASFPTKIAEALACGVPVVSFPGIGDIDRLAAAAPDAIYIVPEGGSKQPAPSPNRHSPRLVAEREFSLASGAARYDSIYSCLLTH